jgi:hypothetical protein
MHQKSGTITVLIIVVKMSVLRVPQGLSPSVSTPPTRRLLYALIPLIFTITSVLRFSICHKTAKLASAIWGLVSSPEKLFSWQTFFGRRSAILKIRGVQLALRIEYIQSQFWSHILEKLSNSSKNH